MKLAVIFVALIAGCGERPFDDTDAPPKRSGLEVHTDHKTGCQYLSYSYKSITPRLDATGKPMCGETK